MSQAPALVWFRNDLRLEDNPALHAARACGAPVVALYVLDENLSYAPGAASRWWLHHSLKSLSEALEKAGASLVLRRGESAESVKSVIAETGASHVFWNRRYEGPLVDTDKALKAELHEQGVDVATFNGALLREPWEVKTKTGGAYSVFTPFWKALRNLGPARDPLPKIRKIKGADAISSDHLDDWGLLPYAPNWAKEFDGVWKPGEKGAQEQLKRFLTHIIEDYADQRDRPDFESTSRLSPHLAFGEISPVQIWRAIHTGMAAGAIGPNNGEKFLSEIAWREFSYNILFNNLTLVSQPLRQNFKDFPWREDEPAFKAWTRGMTGFPIVDAGMRQLWRTGWMHNRVRMIVASFLLKDLLIDWRKGEAWFRDTLVDADIANNAASWQWVAGSGADAAPYFRIFNPVTQGEKFDPDGDYVRCYVPELADLPKKFIHAPWTAPVSALEKAGITLGKTYPIPIIDHSVARKRALRCYDAIKGG